MKRRDTGCRAGACPGQSVHGQPPARRTVSVITPRDVAFLNEAVLRLLRLLVARGAVGVAPHLRDKLFKQQNLKLSDISQEEFAWLPDCEPVTTKEGIGIEAHEQDVIDFWEQNRIDLESIEQQLDRLWYHAATKTDGLRAVMRNALRQLGTTADGLRGRTLTISHPDANAFRPDFDRTRLQPFYRLLWLLNNTQRHMTMQGYVAFSNKPRKAKYCFFSEVLLGPLNPENHQIIIDIHSVGTLASDFVYRIQRNLPTRWLTVRPNGADPFDGTNRLPVASWRWDGSARR